MDLAGRVALVTGGGTGLGAAVCRALAGRGAAVAVNFSRSREEAETLAGSLPRAVAVQADVRDELAIASMVREVEAALGPVDLLVNNAGITAYVSFEDLEALSAGDWDRILGVNLVGAWSCVRAVVPGMRARGAGAVVNVASDSAFTLDGSSIPYVVSKAGLVALTHTLASALAPVVRVNAVAPGWMDTPWLDRYVPTDRRAALREGREPTVPVGDAAEAVVALLKDDAATGQVVQLTPPG